MTHFQCHNLRASKLTWLSLNEGLKDAEVMAFSGHKKMDNMRNYIKVPQDELLEGMLEAQQKEHNKSTNKTESYKPVITPSIDQNSSNDVRGEGFILGGKRKRGKTLVLGTVSSKGKASPSTKTTRSNKKRS